MKIKNFIPKIKTYFKEVRLEMKKVNWPTRKETIKYTIIVVGICVVTAAFLGGLDAIYQFLLDKMIRIF